MNSLDCRICGCESLLVRQGRLFDRDVCYYDCNNCRYVQTQTPTWLDQAYSSPINFSDTGILARNLMNTSLVLASLFVLGLRKGTVVDYAGGYGFLVRLLRDKGVDAFWMDGFCENLVSRGFEYRSERADLVTAFEVFEHFTAPVCELEKMFAIAPDILFSTSLFSLAAEH